MDRRQVFYDMIEDGDIAALERFLNKEPDFLLKTIDDGTITVYIFHYVVKYGNTAVLDCVYKNAKEHAQKLLTSKDDFTKTVFHVAAERGNIANLDWLYNHVQDKDLIKCMTSEDHTVFHYAVESNNSNTAVLNWLYDHTGEHAVKLLTTVGKDNLTVFHLPAKWGNIAVLDWFYDHIQNGLSEELAAKILTYKYSNRQTVFHHAIKYGRSTVVLDWLYKHAGRYARELLTCRDGLGNTVFDHVEKLPDGPEKTNIIRWLHEHH